MKQGEETVPVAAIAAARMVAGAGDQGAAVGCCPAFIRARIDGYLGTIVASGERTCVAAFPSVGDATACVAEVQRELARRGARLSAQRRPRLKIGINLCHLAPGDAAAGSKGVAYARRLRDMAEPGGLCASAVIGDRLTTRRTAAQMLEVDDGSHMAAATLQYTVLLGYFALWMGLIAWRAVHYAMEGSAPCWMPAQWLCN